MKTPTLHLDRSGPQSLLVERDGKRLALEEVFRTGFTVRPEDCPTVITLLAQFLISRDETQKKKRPA